MYFIFLTSFGAKESKRKIEVNIRVPTSEMISKYPVGFP
jgi:hypothetical protein